MVGAALDFFVDIDWYRRGGSRCYVDLRAALSLYEDFTRMLVIAGSLSASSLLLLRVCLFAINNDDKVYSEYEFSSTNIVVISLLLGLQQCSHRSFTASANPIVFGADQQQKPVSSSGVRPLTISGDPFAFKP